jgi:hypothetical protein
LEGRGRRCAWLMMDLTASVLSGTCTTVTGAPHGVWLNAPTNNNKNKLCATACGRM